MTTTSSARAPQGLGLALAVLALAAALFGDGVSSRRKDVFDSPPLYRPRPACTTPATAEARAQALSESALAKLERYAFAPAEGAEALARLSEAAHCYDAAGRPDASAATRQQLREAQARLEHDYQQLRLRLAHALTLHQEHEAQTAARALLLLLAGQDGAYVASLRRIARGAQ